MLIEFRVKNYKSFRDEQVLSMVASPDASLPENVMPVPALKQQRVCRSAVVYGANASGKSNLIAAFSFVHNFVASSVDRRPLPLLELENEGSIPVKPFLLDGTSSIDPSEFELTFIHHGTRYQYGFCVDRQSVRAEWLVAYPKGSAQSWFDRRLNEEGDYEWHFGSRLAGEKKRLIDLTRPDALFLSVAAAFNHRQLSVVHEWFFEYLRPVQTNEGVLDQFARYTAARTKDDPRCHRWITHLLREADLGITDFRAEEIPITEDHLPKDMPESLRSFLLTDTSNFLNIQMFHQSSDGKHPGVPFSQGDESLGTQRLFALGGPLFDTLERGLVMVADELDASLHPNLVRALVRMFHNPDLNCNGAQLIFNSHDTTLLDTSLFRRDQVWFVDKSPVGASRLYPLLEFSPRKEHSIERGYRQGRYGAIPFIGNMMKEFAAHGEE